MPGGHGNYSEKDIDKCPYIQIQNKLKTNEEEI
jgi:hypothetical protein